MPRVLVTGTRHGGLDEKVRSILGRCHHQFRISELVQGGAKGIDAQARSWARAYPAEIKLVTIEADWKKHKKRAGPIRNREMVELQPVLVLAFPAVIVGTPLEEASPGTWDCIRQALRANIPVEIHPVRVKLPPKAEKPKPGDPVAADQAASAEPVR